MNKGFTLVELLAVIVILAIIALIATPIVINVIGEARDGANKRSVEGYMKAWESAYYQKMLSDQSVKFESIANSDIQYSGSQVTCEGAKIDSTTNQITATKCTVNGKDYSYSSKDGASTYKASEA